MIRFRWSLVALFIVTCFALTLQPVRLQAQQNPEEGHERIKWAFDFRAYEVQHKLNDELSEEQASKDYQMGDTAIASDGTIYFTTVQGFLYALTPQGQLKWVVGGRNTREDACLGPKIGNNGTIYVPNSVCGTNHTGMKAFNPNGSLKWESEDAFLETMAIGTDGTLYGTYAGRYLLAADPNNGKLKWQWECPMDPTDPGHKLNLNCFGENSSPNVGKDGTLYVELNSTKKEWHVNGNLKKVE